MQIVQRAEKVGCGTSLLYSVPVTGNDVGPNLIYPLGVVLNSLERPGSRPFHSSRIGCIEVTAHVALHSELTDTQVPLGGRAVK